MKKEKAVFNVKLDPEEQEILDYLENEDWQSSPDFEKEAAKAKQAAQNTLRKNAKINIRLSSLDLERIKRIAVHEGLPYQTLIASVLHKYAVRYIRHHND